MSNTTIALDGMHQPLSRKPVVLIVDDQEQNVEYLEIMLLPLSVETITAYSGQEALEKIKNQDLAVALIDVMMPEMNGLDLAKHILKENNRDLFPIIFITAYPLEEKDLVNVYNTGITDFITKPFSKQILLSKIRIFLELYRQKQLLASSEQLYRMLLNASPEGIVIMEIAGIIREVSSHVLEVFGIPENQAVAGRHISALFPAEEHSRLVDVMGKTIREGLTRNCEFRAKKGDGTHFIVEISTTLIGDHSDDSVALMAIIRDISLARKQQERQIQTERMASLGEMATGIAHEINQPLNNISFGMDNLLAELRRNPHPDPEYLKLKTSRIFDNIDRIAYIIDHIRTFSRGQDDYIRSSFSINESILNGVSMIREQFKTKGIELEINLDDSLPVVAGNTHRFEQVILNLILNAKDAIEEKVRSGLQQEPNLIRIGSSWSGTTILIEVSDNGTGMTPSARNQVMFPFFTTKESGKGTGLGLSISLGIIKELKGTIEVDSQYGRGTTMRIIIPVSPEIP